jgi:hypothetical protein
MLHADGEILGVTQWQEIDEGRPALRRRVVKKLAVDAFDLGSHRDGEITREFTAGRYALGEFDHDVEGRVLVVVARDLHHELACDVAGGFSAFQGDRDVLRVDVRAVERDREARPTEHIYERKLSNRNAPLRLEVAERILPVVFQKGDEIMKSEDPSPIEDSARRRRR